MIAAVLCASLLAGAAGELPADLRGAPPNTWVKVADGGLGKRSSAALVWLEGEGRFCCIGGAMPMLPRHNAPYTEMTLDLAGRRWENRFPQGKLGAWGDLVGPSRAPGFAGSYYRPAMIDTEGNVRPYLGAGYDRSMFLYGNCAWDSDRRRAIVAWHLGRFTTEYDPAGRSWRLVADANAAPDELWDDLLWGAMCYDPINREVLAGRGRWAWSPAAGTWRRLTFADTLLDGPRAKAEALRLRAQQLVGAARSRYYLSETPQEAKLRLDEAAGKIADDVAALAAELRTRIASATERQRTQRAWALTELTAAQTALRHAAGLLAGGVAREDIWAVEDARDWLDRAARELAVAPPPRAFSPMVYDPVAKRIVMFGGDRMDRLLADTWVYDPAGRTWQPRSPKRSPPPRAGHGLVWLSDARKVLLLDGYGCGDEGRCWVYDTAADEWSPLAGGAAKRPTFTERPRYQYLPGPAAAGAGDLVVAISNTERGGIETWAARIDATRIDEAAAEKLGVPPLTTAAPAGQVSPRWYEQHGPPPDPNAEDRLRDLPPNTWVALTPPNNPQLNRAWGTTVLDAARDQLIQWGGGHAAYCGNDPLHYSIRTNRCSTGSFLPDNALNWNGSMLGPPVPTTFAGRPHTPHSYHHYGVDPRTDRAYVFNRMSGNRFWVYDPHARRWAGTIGREFSPDWQGAHHFLCVPTPKGLTFWATPKLLLRLHADASRWDELPVRGELPRMRVDHHGMAYDSRRDRLLLFSEFLQGDVVAYDLKTGRARPLGATGGEGLHVFLREALYVPHADVVLAGTRRAGPDGRSLWPYYDCAANAWSSVALAGPQPVGGRDGKAEHSVGLGLCYDAKRKLVWAVGSRMEIHVLRLEPPAPRRR